MSDIVERLRSLRHVHLPQLSDEAAAEIERLRHVVEQKSLTGAERDAVKEASEFYIGSRTGKALSGLLGRLGVTEPMTKEKRA